MCTIFDAERLQEKKSDIFVSEKEGRGFVCSNTEI